MPCCINCVERDIEDLEKEYYKLSNKYDKIIKKVDELNTIVQELRHNNDILFNDYTRIKNEYNDFLTFYYGEIDKKK